MKAILRRLFARSLARLDLVDAMRTKVCVRRSCLMIDDESDESINLARVRHLVVIAIGKAAVPMTAALTRLLTPHPFEGIVVGVTKPAAPVGGCTYFVGGHPVPNDQSFEAGSAIVERLRRLGDRDLVIYLLSGGGSALAELPIDRLGRGDVAALYARLVTSGLPIADMNIVRKHLSRSKGGQLAAAASPARQITLYVSDVPADNPSAIASGPTMPDASSAEECRQIVERSGLLEHLPQAVRRIFDERRIRETPKPGSPLFASSRWVELLGSADAKNTVAGETQALDWRTTVDDAPGETWGLEQTVDHLLVSLDDARRTHPHATVAVVSGGEFSCPVSNPGLGGRNQAFVLACVPRIAGRRIAVLSAGTDGIDGSAPAAGAVADGDTLARAAREHLDPDEYLRRADAHRFFEPLGDAVVTGPTGHNVRDVRVLVAW